MGGDLPVTLFELGGVTSPLLQEQIPEALGVHVARQFHGAK
jgi:hypothetical protein